MKQYNVKIYDDMVSPHNITVECDNVYDIDNVIGLPTFKYLNLSRLNSYNVFDLNNGKDFIITLQYVPSTEKTTLTISDAGKETPLSKDVNKAMSWVNDEKTWTDLYSLKPFEYLELVSSGKVPYFNKDAQKWVDKATMSNEDIAAAEARKILENGGTSENATKPIDTTPQLENEQDVEGDDLPF